MKTKVLLIIMALAILASCGKPDKASELANLKKQRDEISAQIKILEQELAVSDTVIDNSKARLIAVKELKNEEFNHYIEVQGKLDGDENVSVSTPMGGNIQEILVKVGQKVTKGQLMARLDDKVLVQTLKELQTGLDFATEMYNKQKSLWDQKIGSEVQYLNAKNQKESLEQRIATVQNQLDMMHIKSPINGSVEDIPVKVGQMLAPGFVAFRVVNFSKLKVTADVAESYASKIKEGDNVIVYFPDIQKEIEAKVTFASKFINNINRTFGIEIRFQSENNSLKANMIAMLKVNDYKNRKAIVIPINNVQTDQKGSFVYIAQSTEKGYVAKKIYVEQGVTYNGQVEIAKGLNINDKMVTAGYLELEDGEAIKF